MTLMPYSYAVSSPAKSVANEYLRLAEIEKRPLTNMQLQKLVYIAHGFDLAINDTALIADRVEAWTWGPVIPTLYQTLKKYGSRPVTEPIADVPAISEGDTSLVDEVWKGYGRYTAARLSAITHQTGSPWDVVWRLEAFGTIPDALTAQYYKTLLAR